MSKDILLLTPFYPPNLGGAETYTEQLAQEASRWFNITVLTLQPMSGRGQAYEEYFYPKGSLKIHRLGGIFRPRKAWKGLSVKNFLSVFLTMFFPSLIFCLKKKPSVIHAQGLLSGLIAVMLKRIIPCKVLITLLALYDFDDQSKLFCALARWIFNNSDCIFVEGLKGEQDAWGAYRKIFKHMGDCEKYHPKFKQFTHWCDQTIFKPDPKRLNDKIRVLFVGRPIPEKGMHIVEAAERILNNPKYEFTYVTNVKHSDLPKIYQRHHILCVPSQYDEGYSRVVVEGACCGCAVITSDRGSLPEQVSGFGWQQPNERISLSIGLMEIGNTINHWGKLASEYAKNNFTSKNVEVFLNAYSGG